MNTKDTKLLMFLDLMDAGYKNAYVSVMDFQSQQNNPYHRIEIVLQNVGRLCLYQTFRDVMDVQMPYVCVFYSVAMSPNTTTKVRNPVLLNRAVQIVYDCKKYFEAHPEHIVDNSNLKKIIKSNQHIAEKQKFIQKRIGVLQIFTNQK